MSQKQNEGGLLVWAANKIRKAQDDKAHCTITIHIRDGEIYRAERTDSYIPPKPGALLKQTGG